jgi:predicted nucleic acid-binding protein
MLMASPSFLIEASSAIVLDTSAAINIQATRRAPEIFEALPCPIAVTDILLRELDLGRQRGRREFEAIETLIRSGAIDVVGLEGEAEDYFEGLVVGSAANTLDDGEAATIAHALAARAIAVIDERKATTMCVRRFNELKIASTIDVLLQPSVRDVLGLDGLREAALAALETARMSVPPQFEEWIVDLIGVDAAARCISLPRRVREVRPHVQSAR